ncbi:hypothetical protein IMZ48_05290 [Candidatus Bathyarchaeota archaeon]|nr:hypothetical protein [Candidatus Bathyarchaeota archaeon]
MALITKAGMPSKKVVVGVASYGRSFRMADPNCTGPDCFFTGDRLTSDAFPGPCTNTSGYLADAEIMGVFTDYEALPGDDSGIGDFVTNNTGLESMGGYTGYEWYDEPSDSDILIYTDGQSWDWLAYMDSETKAGREDWYRGLNFAGTSDWAVDLGSYYEEELDGGALDVEDLRCKPDELRPGSFEELEENLDNMPEKCRLIYGIELLQDQLDGAVDSYDDAKDGFDELFKWYEDYVKDNVTPMLREFMDIKNGPGNKFFTCKWKQIGEKTEKCPPHTDFTEARGYTIEYILDDEEGFYKALEEDLGVAKDWVRFGEKNRFICDPTWTNQTPGASWQPCREITYISKGLPLKADDMEVPNPKELVETAMPNITELARMNEASLLEVALSMYDGDDGDVMSGASLPVFMLEGAAESMKKIKELGTELKKTAERDLILMIVGIVLMVIPFVGELGAVLTGSIAVARFSILAAEAGGIALTVEEIIHDPDSAPLAIAGLLLGAGTGGRTRPRSERFKDAGDATRALDAGSLKVLPQRLRDRHASIQRIDKYCRLG